MDNEKMLGGDDVNSQCGWKYCDQSELVCHHEWYDDIISIML